MKNKGLRITILLLLIVLVGILSFNTWAKYIKSFNKTTSFSVAKWDFDNENPSGTIKLDISSTVDPETLKDGLIAPGTAGSFDFVVTNGRTEVATRFSATIDIAQMTNKPHNMRFYYMHGTEKKYFNKLEINGRVKAKDATGVTVPIYWEWKKSDNVVSSQLDTLSGETAGDILLKIEYKGIQILPLPGLVINSGYYMNLLDENNLYLKLERESEKGVSFDYSKPNSPLINGEGLYEFSETKEEPYPVYFYRGTHNLNNNLIYANFCWKIVRTTETGGVRLVYNGTPVNGECQTTEGDATQIGTSAFNSNYKHKKYVGYMYGEDDSPYENKYDSTVKTRIDTWFEENIKSKVHEGTLDKVSTYCGDRREDDYRDDLWMPDGDFDVLYASAKRNYIDHSPSLNCEENDSYGVEGGNKALTNPVGLLTFDEYIIAGGTIDKENLNYYLFTDISYWFLSPMFYDSWFIFSTPFFEPINAPSIFDQYNLPLMFGVRPAVTLAPSTVLAGGDGSKKAPFLVS